MERIKSPPFEYPYYGGKAIKRRSGGFLPSFDEDLLACEPIVQLYNNSQSIVHFALSQEVIRSDDDAEAAIIFGERHSDWKPIPLLYFNAMSPNSREVTYRSVPFCKGKGAFPLD